MGGDGELPVACATGAVCVYIGAAEGYMYDGAEPGPGGAFVAALPPPVVGNVLLPPNAFETDSRPPPNMLGWLLLLMLALVLPFCFNSLLLVDGLKLGGVDCEEVCGLGGGGLV